MSARFTAGGAVVPGRRTGVGVSSRQCRRAAIHPALPKFAVVHSRFFGWGSHLRFRRVDVLGTGISNVRFNGGGHDSVRHRKRVDRITAPLVADFSGFLVLQGRAESEHSIWAQDPEVTRSASVEGIPDVIPEPKDIRAKCWEIMEG